jgi:tetratricopeptide (TPR) repeat protein
LQTTDASIAGRRVALVGRLTSMSRRDAEKLIRDRGGRVAERIDAADWVVVGDEASDVRRAAADREPFDESARAAFERGEVELIRESELWARLGLLDADLSVAHLYTPALLADLVKAPIAAIRQWHRQGALRAKREVRRLPYFDFEEVCVARKLAALWAAGCSLSAIHRKLGELSRLLPTSERPLADPEVVVERRCLYIRRGENLAEPSGQLLIDFSGQRPPATGELAERGPVAVPFAVRDALRRAAPQRPRGSHPYAADDLRSLAVELEESGRSDQAIEVYRAILVSGEYTADDHFALAELLYRTGDLPAARERYYVAIELDEDYVEARSNLGCVLAEQGEVELAEAAFRGALACHPSYADAHYHLARLLDRLGQTAEAALHWQQFTDLAPASPWADEARDRIGGLQAE